MSTSSLLVALFAFSSPGLADCYLHAPMGSNNRLDEQNRERANANRLFDSQNNNRGGYNVGKMRYYHKEKLPISWTNQHGTQKYQMEHSELIAQYKCDPLIRDGTTTRTIPTKATECYNYDCDTDVRFGRHESLDHYKMCQKTERDKGLLTINQNLRGDAAQYTRQNPQGTRFGYECPEERDYYPYDRPNGGWIDAFIVTADIAKCAQYQAESQNVKSKFECRMPDAFFDAGGTLPNNFLYKRNQADCVQQTLETEDGTTYTAQWNEVAAYGVPPPDCVLAAQTRANHLGNPGGKDIYEVAWEIPDIDIIPENAICTMRMRYNITTGEYGAYATAASVQAGRDATFNSNKTKPNANNDPANIPIWADYGVEQSEIAGSFNNDNGNSREYVLKNNPQPNAFGDNSNGGGGLLEGKVANTNDIKLQLAVNTAQYGRGFQDRTHSFMVMARPTNIPADAQIIQQTVRGKRGNIVQTFPATEYFHYPAVNYIPQNEYMYTHWTGSNTNPNNNDGQGKQGTDRSNMCCTRIDQYDTSSYSNFEDTMTYEDGNRDHSSAGVSYPGYAAVPEGYVIPDQLQSELLQNPPCMGMNEDTLKLLCTTRAGPHDYGNMEELDDAGASFQMPPIKMETKGCWNIIGTRNHNFSNRDQKGKICTSDGDVGSLMVSSAGAEWWDESGRSGARFWSGAVAGMERAHIVVKEGDHTQTVMVANVNLLGTVTVGVAYTPQALHKSNFMWQEECDWAEQVTADGCGNEWIALESEAVEWVRVNDGNVAQADVTSTGTFMVVNTPNWRPILALVVAVLAFTCALGWVLWQKCGLDCPSFCEGMKPGGGNNSVQEVSGPMKVVSGPTKGKAPPPFAPPVKTTS